MMGIIILGVIVVLAGAVIGLYNKLVKGRIHTDEAWSSVDVQLKRRYDLIPNIVETVKGYAAHEKETLDAVIKARSEATSIDIDISKVTPEQMATFSQTQSGLSGALGKLFALAENYPDLKANQNFLQLQDELSDLEDAIQAARRFFNSTVRDYNILVQTVPSNIIAGVFGFTSREFFEIAEAEKATPEVKF